MSALLQELQIHNFRNHEYFSIQNPKQLIIIIGRNAVGKTNIIEAVQLVTMLESFRSPHWSTVVCSSKKTDKTTRNNATVLARFLQNGRTIEIQMDIDEGKRSYFLNDKKRNRQELIGLVPSVIFVPDDLTLIKSSSEVRRKTIDDIGQQLSPTYLKILTDYQKTIKQRNAILKSINETKQSPTLLESWNESLVVLGALLFTHRIRLYQRYMEKVSTCYQQIYKEESFSSRYFPSFFEEEKDCLCLEEEENRKTETALLEMDKKEVENRISEKLKKVREKEQTREITLVGPHRDDISFFIDGLDARKYASQGQQRSIALALKLGQLELIKEISGNQPILLLDDVMSELDENRREALINAIGGQIQTIITSTDLNCFNEALLKNAQIIELL